MKRTYRLAWITMRLTAAAIMAWPHWALGQEAVPPIRRLDDATRAKVLAALAALVILGFAMVLLTWLGARVVQRYRRGTAFFRPTRRPGEHEWAKKPLAPPESKRSNPDS